MDQRSALRVLVAHSQLAQETQDEIIASLDTMSDEEVVTLGTSLAEAKKAELAQATKLAAAIDKTLKGAV